MNYEEFLTYIKEHLIKCLVEQACMQSEKAEEEDYVIEVKQVVKNNGIVLDGVTVRKKNTSISPNIYLNAYYDAYQMGKPLSVIMEEIVAGYESAKDEHLEIVDIMDFEAVKDKLTLRLVNYDKNREQLERCPHKRYLDLAVTFRYVANMDTVGIASSLISNQEWEHWDIGLEELYRIALHNTMRDFPWQMDSLAGVIKECLRAKSPGSFPNELLEEIRNLDHMEHGVNLYVLSNALGINGATCMLYDKVISHFAKVQEANVYILPSSVHEVMLVPEEKDTDPEFWGSWWWKQTRVRLAILIFCRIIFTIMTVRVTL